MTDLTKTIPIAREVDECYASGMSTRAASKADLHALVEDLPERSVETAKRFLESLRAAKDPDNAVARFIETMDPEEAALLDGLAELDHEQGAPAFVADDPDGTR